MGKLRVLSGEEVCRMLESEGFQAVRRCGSHRIMQKRTEGTTVAVLVPTHCPLERPRGRALGGVSLELPWKCKTDENGGAFR